MANLTIERLEKILADEEEYANEAQRKYVAAVEQFNADIVQRNGRMAMLRQLIGELAVKVREEARNG